ncbi:site-specific integrase [Rhodovarius crocodyli]|uniref:Site-specific integrase n=1 Tax=Rhodovarius crocodyli TaxID=1979269 RepID=A0A437M2A1_9PROT|nr:site-specific integrase [Rhodovarius crocodyli]RVT91685.1 site-specific integrase [Rhodovarius crocodyli]
MPLKVVARAGTATLYVRGTVRGQSVFESTGTSDPEKAEAYRSKREAELWDRSVYGAKAVVGFAHAVASYLEERERRPADKALISKLLDHYGTIQLGKITQETLPAAYRACLKKGTEAAPATKLRNVLVPLRAILEHAAIMGWCARPAFKAPEVPKQVTPYLRPAEATALVQAAAPHLRPLLVFLIGTGVRLSEALELDWSKVDLRGGRATVWQKQQDERDVELPPAVLAALSALPLRKGPVFRPPARAGRKIDSYRDNDREGGGQIKSGWAGARKRAGLSPEITPHDCRHTWATWHYCIHKDLQRLRDEGGWGSVKMVERYAKRMPDAYREEATAWLDGRAKSVQSAKRQRRKAQNA